MTMPLSSEQDKWKRTASARAVEGIEDGMGLGRASTAALARRRGVPLTNFVGRSAGK